MKQINDVQIIRQDGEPAFAVIPYARYLELTRGKPDSESYTPNEVIGLQVEQGLSLIAAWRVYKGLSQQELASLINVSQPAVAQMEKPGAKPRIKTLEKVADALGVTVEQLTE